MLVQSGRGECQGCAWPPYIPKYPNTLQQVGKIAWLILPEHCRYCTQVLCCTCLLYLSVAVLVTTAISSWLAEWLMGTKRVRADGRDDYKADQPRVRAIVGKANPRYRAWWESPGGVAAEGGSAGPAAAPLPVLGLGSVGAANNLQGAADGMLWDGGLAGSGSQGTGQDAAFASLGLGGQYQPGSLGAHVGGVGEQAAMGAPRVPQSFCLADWTSASCWGGRQK